GIARFRGKGISCPDSHNRESVSGARLTECARGRSDENSNCKSAYLRGKQPSKCFHTIQAFLRACARLISDQCRLIARIENKSSRSLATFDASHYWHQFFRSRGCRSASRPGSQHRGLWG